MNFIYVIGCYLGKHYPKFWISIRYVIRFHKFINWVHPKNLNEKILYLALNTNTSIWTELSDKYKVRKYVETCGYTNALVELYGVWQSASQINFDKLPNKFVLKPNHGCGEIVIVKDKKLINIAKIIKNLNNAISKPYGEIEGGKHYYNIARRIIAEQLLENDEVSKIYSNSIIDYKIWCFNGRAYYIYVCCNRTQNSLDVMLYDRNWIPHKEYLNFTNHYRECIIIPKPENLEDMLKMAEDLSHPFPCVRVDLYNISGKIYFGEMTFTSLGGMMNYFTNDFLDLSGDLIDLNYKG